MAAGNNSIFTIVPFPSDRHRYDNICHCNPAQFTAFSRRVPESANSKAKRLVMGRPIEVLVIIRNRYVFQLRPDENLAADQIGLTDGQLKSLHKNRGDVIELGLFIPPEKIKLESLNWIVMLDSALSPNIVVNAQEIQSYINTKFRGQIFVEDQWLSFRFRDVCYSAVVVERQRRNPICFQGRIGKKTKIRVSAYEDEILTLNNREEEEPGLWVGQKLDLFNMVDLKDRLNDIKLGGMTEITKDILMQAFGSRLQTPSVAKRNDITHQRGILLYGPPGSGKTYLARKICELLQVKQPKIVNGPELKTRWFGETETKIRRLFADAVKDYELHGNSSKLHVIIFDELDSFTPRRSSFEDGFNRGEESALSSLLVAIDGLRYLNNIFIIGTTNRKELIDPALLRPGRIGMSYEVTHPNENNRLEMLKVILRGWIDDGRLDTLDSDAFIAELATLTINLSSASLRALVTMTHAAAVERSHSNTNLKYQMGDFQIAIGKMPENLVGVLSEAETQQDPYRLERLEARVVALERKYYEQGKGSY